MYIAPPPPEVDDKKYALREKVLTTSYDEYKELIAAWRNLDAKAQGNIAVAGIFLAGAFGYLTKAGQPPADYERVFFFFAVIFLLCSVGFSLGVLRIRDAPSPCLGHPVRIAAGHLLALPTGQEFLAYYPAFYSTLADEWERVSKQIVEANKVKGEALFVAQVWLLLAILCAGALTLLKVILWNVP